LVQVVEDVLCLAKVARNLRKDRFDSGALRLDNIKLGFTLDADGNPVGATPHVQREANQTIEEFMLLANRSVAKFISEVYPDRALLRRHCRPDQRQLDALQEATVKMGINLDISSSGALHNSLVQLRGAFPNYH
jgi:exoribonuclease R